MGVIVTWIASGERQVSREGGAGPRLMCEWRYGTVCLPRSLYFQTNTATHPHQLMFPSHLTDLMRIRSLDWPAHEWTSLTRLYFYNSLRNDTIFFFLFVFSWSYLNLHSKKAFCIKTHFWRWPAQHRSGGQNMWSTEQVTDTLQSIKTCRSRPSHQFSPKWPLGQITDTLNKNTKWKRGKKWGGKWWREGKEKKAVKFFLSPLK